MARDCPPSSAEQLVEELRAEALLAKLEAAEDLAEIHDSEPITVVRQTLRRQYQRAIGIIPEQRQQLRASLLRITHGQRRSVAEVMETFGQSIRERGYSAAADLDR